MKLVRQLYAIGYSIIAALFGIGAFALIGLATIELWHAIVISETSSLHVRFSSVLEAIGLLTISAAAMDLSQTVLEEEVQRQSQVSLPTRVRRFLSRFMIVIIVSLSIEFLVATFELVHRGDAQLYHVSLIGFAAAALLSAWGLFIWFNRSAEELEPEAIAEVKREDAVVESGGKDVQVEPASETVRVDKR